MFKKTIIIVIETENGFTITGSESGRRPQAKPIMSGSCQTYTEILPAVSNILDSIHLPMPVPEEPASSEKENPSAAGSTEDQKVDERQGNEGDNEDTEVEEEMQTLPRDKKVKGKTKHAS